MRSRFDQQLDDLNLDLIKMGSMAENAIEQATASLKKQNRPLAERIIESDREVDEVERRIESLCMKLILQQQPVAKDLRFISTALKMITDLERICDQAADIAGIAIRFSGERFIKEPEHIFRMAELAAQMVKNSIDAFVHRDLNLAQRVIDADDEVDELFNLVKHELVDLAVGDREKVDQVVDFLMIAKYLEKIGDHAENIADWVSFSVTGIHKDQKIL